MLEKLIGNLKPVQTGGVTAVLFALGGYIMQMQFQSEPGRMVQLGGVVAIGVLVWLVTTSAHNAKSPKEK